MKILLVGDYSNVHNTLSEGLKTLGHECVVASSGDGWKNYPRDIDLRRELDRKGTLSFLCRLAKALPRMRGFDIVQLINPVFIELRAERIMPFYRYLRRHNGRIVLGAFGMDYYWAQVNTDVRPLRYSDFNIGNEVRYDEVAEHFRQDMIGTSKESLCKAIAGDCDAIVAGLYEYYATYDAVPTLRDKLSYIPFPIKMPEKSESVHIGIENEDMDKGKVSLFIGLTPGRVSYKGTDILLAAAKSVQEQYPDKVKIKIAEGVPFDRYKVLMESSDALLDQIYSYTPSMNSLLAMSKGIIDIGGGEPECYNILNETALQPIINVQPNYESCRKAIEDFVLHPERIPQLKRESVAFVEKHHEYRKVAKQYEELYAKLL